MKKEWSNSWISSKQPRKQRKYKHNAPLHKRRKMMASHLSKELRQKHKKRSVALRKGDKVKILRGKFKSLIGKVEKVMLSRYKVHISGAELKKADGRKAKYPIDPSNLVVIDLEKSDKKRVEVLERK